MLNVAVLLPDLLGTYGDSGNGLVLVERARRRGIEAALTMVNLDDPLPEASIFLVGGGEDGPQRLARDLLAANSLVERVRDGAHVLAVCAGLQILGTTFSVEGDDEFAGLGLVDAATHRGERRSVGDLAIKVSGRWLVGFENHGGRTTLGPSVVPLGEVARGQGNDGTLDGYRSGRIWATYAHGPVLALNPWFADELLESVLGEPLEPLEGVADRLYTQRCRALNLASPS